MSNRYQRNCPILIRQDRIHSSLRKELLLILQKKGWCEVQFDKVIVLGIDGLDPNIMENLMDAKKLPNFSAIRRSGTYRRLTTSNPAQSPVAWSTIATGGNPGCHGIFDFIHRNPKNYLPKLAILNVNERNIFARRRSMFLPARKGTPFWVSTSHANVPTTVIRWPITFPPEQISGRMLSGLGTPDLKANLGRYGFYTTGNVTIDGRKKGDVISITTGSHTIETIVSGPSNSEISMKIHVDDPNSRIIINIGGKSYAVQEGRWSECVRLRFNIGFGRHIAGICRFYLISKKPELKLYLSPIQVDPADPAFPISYPDEYSSELYNKIGNYHTLGMPEDTNGLTDNCFDEEAFLSTCNDIMVEREKMLWYELGRLKEGLLAFVFDTTDRIQHIFWSAKDSQHPTYNKTFAKKHKNIIEDYYRRMDKILGRVLQFVDKKTVIIILSDHGFASFRRAVHLNSWLAQNGFMVLNQSPRDREGGPLFKHVVWEKTKAYALGFSSIYLNLRGRERKGIVNEGDEAQAVKEEITDALVQLKDPKTGQRVIKGIYDREDLYRGPYTREAPDLIVGFQPDYRVSWQTAIGGAPEEVFEDNLKKWGGDHLVDPHYVPGIFLINQKITVQNPSVIDIAPTILRCFQISKPKDMEGNSLL